MATSFLPYMPDQDMLLPPSLREWLPEGHLSYFVGDVIDRLDLKAFYARYEGDGRRNQPHDPRMMAKVLVYAYATGTFSSRKIAKKLEEDVAYRVLAAGNQPAHRTIAEFRQLHLSAFTVLFVDVVKLARELGLVKLGVVGVDGTKLKANASKHKAMSYGRMKEQEARLKREIEELLQRAQTTDRDEDQKHGFQARGDELPDELTRRRERLAQIEAAKARLEARQRDADQDRGRTPDDDDKPKGKRGPAYQRAFGVPPDKTQDNFTDPQSRIMKTVDGFQQCYNAQAAVDGESRLIVATDLSSNGADCGALMPVLDKLNTTLGEDPRKVLADAGYRSEDNFAALEARGIDGYIALGREGKDAPPLKSEAPATQRMKDKLKTPAGDQTYRLRKTIPEPAFGWVKHVHGFRQFSLRGLTKVRHEWDLVCLAVNLRRMNQMIPQIAG